jgi:hypothetical protein
MSLDSQPNADTSTTTLGSGSSEPNPAVIERSTPTNGAAGESQASDESWRNMLSGGDENLGKELARYKSATDVGKELLRQKQELSKGPRILTLSKDAKPEQIAEYRKAYGVPETAEGYDIKAPDGYQAPAAESALVAQFAKTMHAQHAPPGTVKSAVDFYRQATAQQMQAMNKADVDRKTEWQSSLKTEFGKDYEPYVASANAYLHQHFEDNQDGLRELVNARLANGGKLGDNPVFIKMMVDGALKAGLTDRIEASDIENAGGKSLAEQQADIEKLQFKDRAAYNAAQPRLDKIIKARLSKGEIDDHGREMRRRR